MPNKPSPDLVDVDILGWSCRAPGANSVDEFWSLLKDGRCAVREIDDARWSKFKYWHPRAQEAGKSVTFSAGVLDDLAGFDAELFGMSPREAEQVDPQQRIVLEVVWAALENAGIPPSSLAGSETGVFVGAASLDNSTRVMFDQAAAGPHFMTGNTLSIVSNRISFAFDLHGPSFTVDTACSSSLVALNEAMMALQSGRIETAIVAGVNLLYGPFPFVGFSQATMLSPDGLCKAFDESGNGYVRAEGGFAFILRRNDASPFAGQQVLAEIVACDVNSDGRTSGLSLPSGYLQEALLRRVYGKLGLDMNALAFVEAHGTGTRVGDPAEAYSIGTVIGKERKDPLLIGSVKTNIGHLEPASGLAGLAKSVLALQNDLLPPSLHFETPNPDIDFEELNLKVAAQAVTLPREDKPRYAGISSFGFGGTNAHVVIRDPVAAQSKARQVKGVDQLTLAISARSYDALRDLAAQYRSRFDGVALPTAKQISAASWRRRERFADRLVLSGKDAKEICVELDAFIDDDASGKAIYARAQEGAPKVGYVYSGNGSQFAGMGVAAYRNNKAFQKSFDRVDALHIDLAGWSLAEILEADDLSERLQQTCVAQPMLFAVQIALTDALRDRGFCSDFVFGHSVGEVAAAWASGVISLEQAVRIVVKRSATQELVAGSGTMAALVLSSVAARKALEECDFPDIEIAAINSPKSVTISGPRDDIEAFAKIARRKRWVCRVLDLNYPFHSALVEPVEVPFLTGLGVVETAEMSVPMISTVTGNVIHSSDLDAGYWWRNLREQVLFHDATATAIEEGVGLFVEIGPRAILGSYVREALVDESATGAVLPSLDIKDRDDEDPINRIVNQLIANGAEFEDARVFGAETGQVVSLPVYPFQRRPFALPVTSDTNGGLLTGGGHPLLGWRSNDEATQWTTHLDEHVLALLGDHVVNGMTIFPGSGYVEIAFAAAREWFGHDAVSVRDLEILQPIVFSQDHLTEIQTRLSVETGTIEILSRERLSDEDWIFHASARLAKSDRVGQIDDIDLHKEASLLLDAQGIYEVAETFGLSYGPVFRRAKYVEKLDKSTLRLTLDVDADRGQIDHLMCAHPADVDAGFHGLFALFEEFGGENSTAPYVPVRMDEMRLFAVGVASFVQIEILRASQFSILANFYLYDDQGKVLSCFEGVRLRRFNLGRRSGLSELTYHISKIPLAAVDLPFKSVVVFDDIDLGDHADCGDIALLIDLAAHRVACDVMAVLANADGVVSIDAFSEEDAAYFQRLLGLCAHIGAVEFSEDGRAENFSVPAELPVYSELVATLLTEAPDEIATVALLSRARERALDIAGGQATDQDYAPALVDHFFAGSPATREKANACASLIGAYVKAVPVGRRIRILDLGGIGSSLYRLVKDQASEWAVDYTIAERDSAMASRIRVSIEDEIGVSVVQLSDEADDLKNLGPFDLVISAGHFYNFLRSQQTSRSLCETIRHDGRLILLEPEPDAYHDVVFGLTGDWFDARMGRDFALSPMLTMADLKREVTNANMAILREDVVPVRGHSFSFLIADKQNEAADIISLYPDDDEVPKKHALVLVESVASRALGEKLSETLKQRDFFTQVVDPTDIVADSFQVSEDLSLVVDLSSIGAKHDDPSGFIAAYASRLIQFSQLWPAEGVHLKVVLPNGSGQADDLSVDPVQHALWNFGRVFANETPDVGVCLIDVDPRARSASLVDDLNRVFDAEAAESELLVRPGKLYGLRAKSGAPVSRQSATAATLTFDQAGKLNQLYWLGRERAAPCAGEIEIEVAASGLNFRDVMWALGTLPDEALEDGFSGPALGLEVSGFVKRVGPGVQDFAVGDRVVAFVSEGFTTHSIVDANAAVKISIEADMSALATLPVAFLTAYYSLYHLGRVRENETVLIHGGAGGVGLAALQICKWLGAKVIATAGSPEKRRLLKDLGADYVLDSRSLAFADQVMDLTDGKGVNAVLNSLFGEAMELSIGVLAPFGRFLELGKRDYYGNSKIGLRPFRKNLSYFGIDVDQLLTNDVDLARMLIKDMFSLFDEGIFTPLPYRNFGADDAIDSFRLMQQSGHIGKITVTPPKDLTKVVQIPNEQFEAPSDGAVLVVGGLGGFGVEVTRWLISSGARDLVLISRSGAVCDELAELIEASDAKIHTAACDASDEDALASLLDDIRTERPLKGVVHAAMVLDDGVLSSMTQDRFETVLRAKVDSARLLDKHTSRDPLDLFILFSSATTLVGNPGQANYVAANGYLEGLARSRRKQGKTALAVAWGAIADAGYLARNAETGDTIARRVGAGGLPASEALGYLAQLIGRDEGRSDQAVVVISRFDWSGPASELPFVKTPFFDALRHRFGSSSGDGGELIDILGLIAGKSAEDAQALVAGLIAVEIGEILRLPADAINPQRPVVDLGMDSLMGLELRTAVQQKFGVTMPVGAIDQEMTLNKFADEIIRRAGGELNDDDNDNLRDLSEGERALANKHVGGDIAEILESEVGELREKLTKIADSGKGLL